jgi:16S rRNA (uracil1498-N3)-methyltransferase
MPRLYLREEPAEGVFHLNRQMKKRLLKVLRLRTGDLLEVFAPGGKWECRISKILPGGLELAVLGELSLSASPKLELTLAQAIPKGERFEWLIQKCTELGVSHIFPLITERTVVRPANPAAKVQRWNEISEQAAGQSENSFPALVHPPEPLPTFLQRSHTGLKLLLHEREESESLHNLLQRQTADQITFVVGPEGGWATQETSAMMQCGFQKVHLGKRILRSDTAGLVVASIIQYQLGDFSE